MHMKLAAPLLLLSLALASRCADTPQQQTKQPERFNTVTIALKLDEDMKNPEQDGRILVAGVVKDAADLEYIKQLVASKEPPMEVEWSVRVVPKQ